MMATSLEIENRGSSGINSYEGVVGGEPLRGWRKSLTVVIIQLPATASADYGLVTS